MKVNDPNHSPSSQFREVSSREQLHFTSDRYHSSSIGIFMISIKHFQFEIQQHSRLEMFINIFWDLRTRQKWENHQRDEAASEWTSVSSFTSLLCSTILISQRASFSSELFHTFHLYKILKENDGESIEVK